MNAMVLTVSCGMLGVVVVIGEVGLAVSVVVVCEVVDVAYREVVGTAEVVE